MCLAGATVSDPVETVGNDDDDDDDDDDGETLDMPEMNTPNISLEVSETAKHSSTGIIEDNNELSVTPTTQEHDGLKMSEVESLPENEIPVPKPQPEEDIPVPELQPEDQGIFQMPIPEPRSSSLTASGDAFSQQQGRKLYPKPMPVHTKPIPAHRSKPTSIKGKLLPLREKLAENANKLLEYPEEISFVPTAEWVRDMDTMWLEMLAWK